MKRIDSGSQHGRCDFMDSMPKPRGKKDGLTGDELVSNAGVMIIAGSETTATLISSVTYWLLRTAEALRRVTEEVRTAFVGDGEIDFTDATARLLYVLACLDKGFRMYPPLPSGLQRCCASKELPRFQDIKYLLE